MKTYSILATTASACAALLITSCSKEDPGQTTIPDAPVAGYSGEKAVEVREETVIELLAIKDGVKETIEEHRKAKSLDTFVSALESFRPRLEYVHMQTKMLPKQEQMVVHGNLAVATNQLEKELLSMLAKAPGNDSLAMEIASIRENLSPIPLGSVLRKF